MIATVVSITFGGCNFIDNNNKTSVGAPPWSNIILLDGKT